MKKTLFAFVAFAFISNLGVAQGPMEFRLSSSKEIVTEQALPAQGLLTSQVTYEVEIPREDGPVEKYDRIREIYTALPQPSGTGQPHRYQLDRELAPEGKYPPTILVEGLEQKDSIYVRTSQFFSHTEAEKGLYRAEKPAVRTELIKESKFLAELNQFRKENGLEALPLSVAKVTPFPRSIGRLVRREMPRIPKLGNLKFFSAQSLYPPSDDQRFFLDEKEVSFFEFHARKLLDPRATAIDVSIEIPPVEKGLFGNPNPPETLFILMYDPE